MQQYTKKLKLSFKLFSHLKPFTRFKCKDIVKFYCLEK